MTRDAVRASLEHLAERRGVAVSYLGVDNQPHVASDETLVGVLAALGEPVERPEDADEALAAGAAERDFGSRSRRRAGRHPGDPPELPPVLLAWDGELVTAELTSRWSEGAESLGPLWVQLEDGSERPLDLDGERDNERGSVCSGEPLPFGVHGLFGGSSQLGHVVSAPARPNAPDRPNRPDRPGRPDWPDRSGRPNDPGEPAWALFAPTYALVDARQHGSGDLGSLRLLGELAAGLGASAIATLPLLAEPATADGAPPGQQPYAPLSRMRWNEAVLDLARLPELDPDDRDAVERGLLDPVLRFDRDGRPLADLAGVTTLARPVLERAADRLARGRSARQRDFAGFCAGGGNAGAGNAGELERYCRFRAALEQLGPDRRRWPQHWRDGDIPASEVSPAARRRHAYAQFATDRQLGSDARALAAEGCGLLLDLPIGCRPDGYDPWAHPKAFARAASVGAPPDSFFSAGQNWGFPPPDPEVDRRAGYRLLRAVLAHHLAHASWLRVDHVLGWRRLWWVPEGMAASEGAYVRYPTEELVAVACLEAWRTGSKLVGEDLGTVPRGLRPMLHRHGVSGMSVAVFDLLANPGRRLSPSRETVAYVDTHDTATFAGFVSGAEVDQRKALGLLSAEAGEAEREERRGLLERLRRRLVRSGRLAESEQEDVVALYSAVLEELGESEAELVVVSLEDCYGEQVPQNVPGTTRERANFARRLARPLEELAEEEALRKLLWRLGRARTLRRQPSAPAVAAWSGGGSGK